MNRILILVLVSALLSCNNTTEQKQEPKKEPIMTIKKEPFGKIKSEEVYLYTLENQEGMIVKITNYGGIVTSVLVPDSKDIFDDVVLGYDNLQGYLEATPYFGCIVGRYGNRIAKGKFSLDGEEYSLAVNNGENTLHGGLVGFDKVVWDANEFQNKDSAGVILRYVSKDGEEGYPGNLNVEVTYTLTSQNELKIDYLATTDKATPINLTHHSYFNLNGSKNKNILNHELKIYADKYVVVDENLIPTGELRDLTDTPMDFRSSTRIGSRIDKVEGGYDHTYVLNKSKDFDLIAQLFESESGRFIEVYTTEPGVQFYSGNFLDGSITGKNGIVYHKHFGMCLEAQHFPDSPNQAEFPNTILRPGEKYTQTTVYKFGKR
jgi:aldose 1-epimerase